MTFKELFQKDEFREVFGEIEEFSKSKLERYVQELQRQKLTKGGKEIFDAVWGNVEFSNGEIYILDSPLLQRLRGIKQLGLAYYVYCGCDYSRFYHTIGVTYLASRMADAINRCDLATDDGEKAYFKAVVRLAAIFHDVGHMFLSHVSEHYFSKSPFYPRYERCIEGMLSEVNKRTKKKNIALHELLSCMIVNTSAVKILLERIQGCFEVALINTNHDIDELIEYISCLILGVPVDRKILPYANIINGPIDADKCDYLSRDSHVTRVPVAVDISRLTQKLSVVEETRIEMSDVWHDDASPESRFYLLAMKDSAEKALFQLCIARTIMFDSVYYHHKVLTAETEFRNIINRLANLNKPLFTSFYEILNMADDDFNGYFFDSIKKEREQEDCDQIDRIQEDLQNLYERRLAKRAACLMPQYLDGYQSNAENLFDNILTSIDSPEEQTLMEAIKKEYMRLQEDLNDKTVDEERLRVFVIHTPTIVFGHTKIQVPIDLQNGKQREFRGYELVSSRETSSSASYIVSNADDREVMLIALQKVLMQEYGVKVTDEGLSCGKYDHKALTQIYTKLFEQGYYDNTPQLISDELLYNNILRRDVKELVSKYNAYEGPYGYRISQKEIERFFKQVMAGSRKTGNCRTILEGIIAMLNNALFISRQYLSDNLDALLRQLGKNQQKVYVIPLGGLRDSASHIMYFWNDLRSDIIVESEKSLEELLQNPKAERIIFFDDGSFSGTQLLSIMQEYLGLEKVTKEHHVDELPDELKDALRQREIAFFFLAFNKSKESQLRTELGNMGLPKIQFGYIEDLSEGWFGDDAAGIFKSEEQKKAVRDFLYEVGYSVMKSRKMIDGAYKEGWDEERVQKAALGYNDAQQMVFLKSSVPTYTITAFWQRGEFHGMQWNPLFKRTEK